MKRILFRTGIVLFCLWHMFAVGLTSIPRSAEDSFSKATRHLLPAVTPYLQTTSQWQLWDLFAPDPLRRVTLYRIEEQKDGEWTERITIKPGTYSVFRHAVMFKYFINILNNRDDTVQAAQARFLDMQCRTLGIADGTPVRLVLYATILPWLEKPVSREHWKTWIPSMERTIETGTICPSPAAS